MDFGIYLRHKDTYQEMLEYAQKADELGYFGAFLNDHVIGFADDGMEPYHEAWTTMTGIGVQTKNLRVGHIVLFNSLRNPAYLAKCIATLDNMTDGRYELMIGAGWNEREYEGYDLMENGRGKPSAKERVDRFKESIQIINQMLSQKVTSYDGDFWQIQEAINVPQPVQSPFRLSVGCKGSRMMKITANNADGINVGGSYIPDIKDLINKFERIVNKYTENDRTIEDYFISGFASIKISEDETYYEETLSNIVENKEVGKEEAKQNLLVGNSEEVISKFRMLNDKGMDMMVSSISVDESLSDDPLSYFKDNIASQI